MGFRKYSPDVKVLAVRWSLQGLSKTLIQRRLRSAISRKSFNRWTELYHLTCAVIRDPHSYQPRGRRQHLNETDREFMESLVNKQPALFLDEIREKLYNAHGKMPSISTVHLELQSRLMISLKKACVSNACKSVRPKLIWLRDMMGYPSNFLVFTDESAICGRDLLRTHQRSKIGTRTTRKIPKMHQGRYSLLPAISFNGLIALSVLEGPVNQKRFERFLKYTLLPCMNRFPAPNSVLVLDNASIHCGGSIADLCKEKGILLRYLPPYCPELNPIEFGFNVLKFDVRRSQVLVTMSNPVEQIRKAAHKTFTADLTQKLYHHCGY